MDHTKNGIFPPATPTMSKKRADLAPDQVAAFRNFSKEVFKEGELDEKTKQIIAVAVAHVTQCPYCIKGHTKQAKQKGATNKELMEAIWVASEMRAGAAYAHAALALDEMEKMDEKSKNKNN